MTTQPAPAIPHANHHPYKAAAWLVDRHDHAAALIDRVDGWLTGYPERTPDLAMIADGINSYDAYRAAWDDYEKNSYQPRPSSFGDDERAYERAWDHWDAAGPKCPSGFPAAYAPMSSGEHRLFRMLAVFGAPRIRFSLEDASVSLQCCSAPSWGAPRPHRPFSEDWAELITKAVEL